MHLLLAMFDAKRKIEKDRKSDNIIQQKYFIR